MKNEKILNAMGKISDKLIADACITVGKKNHAAAWGKWAAVAACFCLIAAAFIVPRLQNSTKGTVSGSQNDPGKSDLQLSANPSGGIENPNDQKSTTQPKSENVIVVNNVDGIASADMDVQFTHYSDPTESDDVLNRFETAIGFHYKDFIARIPDDFVKKSFYSVDAPNAAKTEYVPHDYVFDYRTSNGGDIKIAICSKGEPLRDCFVMCDNPKRSEINGNTVVILRYQDYFWVRFSWKNVNYDIEASNITLEELEHLLVCIMA